MKAIETREQEKKKEQERKAASEKGGSLLDCVKACWEKIFGCRDVPAVAEKTVEQEKPGVSQSGVPQFLLDAAEVAIERQENNSLLISKTKALKKLIQVFDNAEGEPCLRDIL